jgi:tetratricopeptide (TPR) repeat protein
MSKQILLFFLLVFAVDFAFSQSTDSIIIDTTLIDSELIFQDSITALNEQNELFSSSRRAYNEGLFLFENDKFTEAKAFFFDAVNIDSVFSKAWYYKGKCYQALNNDMSAEIDFITSYRLDSSNFSPLYALAKIQANNNIDLAIKTYYSIIKSSNQQSKAYYEIGVLFYLQKNIEGAIESFTNSISLRKDARTFNDRASCYRMLDNNELAIKDYITAIALNSDLAFIYNNLASTYRKQGDSAKALSYYSLAISKDTNYVLCYNNRGSLHLDLNDIDNALLDINKAISIDNDYAPAYNNKGVMYHQQKRYTEALSYFDKAILLNNNYAKAHLNRGITRQMIRDEDGACNDWIKAKKLGINVANKYLVNDCN